MGMASRALLAAFCCLWDSLPLGARGKPQSAKKSSTNEVPWRFLPPTVGRDFPHPRREPQRCGCGRSPPPQVLLCDPSGLLAASLASAAPKASSPKAPSASSRKAQRTRALASLEDFEAELGAHLGAWGVSAGVALVDLPAEPLADFAAAVAEAWGLTGTRGALLVLQAGGSPAVAFAGGFATLGAAGSADEQSGAAEVDRAQAASWLGDAQSRAAALLRAGRLADAVEAGLAGLASAAFGVQSPLQPRELSPRNLDQRILEEWKTEFQGGEIWENVCAESRCMELFLGEVRQLSDRFEPYYHEAMTFPALNMLGPSASSVLVLGGGDGGVATHALRYDTVRQVVNVDIDAKVSEVSKKWLPGVAAAFGDPRFEMVHGDAFAWVKKAGGLHRFDLIVIDFTDEPVKGAWSQKFFEGLKAILAPGGALVQNIGTMLTPGSNLDLFNLHSKVLKNVWPMTTHIPDYTSPYILYVSSDVLDPDNVDWSFWERQGITAMYYGPEVHKASFALPADLGRLLGLLPEANESDSGDEEDDPEVDDTVLHEESTEHGHIQVSTTPCTCWSPDNPCRSFRHNREVAVTCFSVYRDEAMIMPAMNMLGAQARRVLVLGGGTGGLVEQAVKFPTLERLVVVEIDAKVVQATRIFFPGRDAAFADTRVEIVIADALEWMLGETGTYDLVVVNLVSELWREPSRTSRVPATRAFMRRLQAAIAPTGLLVSEIGSVSSPRSSARTLELHRAVFDSVWPMIYSSLDTDLLTGDELDGRFRRPPLLLALSSPSQGVTPGAVDWARWEASGIETTFYHRGLHDALFVLPAELQRTLKAAPPAAVAHPLSMQDSDAGLAPLVQSLSIEARICDEKVLNSTTAAESLLTRMATLGELTALDKISYQFSPQGVTALLLVSESHLGLHTWPEHGFAVVDMVSCKVLPAQALRRLEDAVREALLCKTTSSELRYRGFGLGEATHQVPAADGRDEL